MAGPLTPENISTKLERIAKLARQMPGTALRSLAHHIDLDWLREAHRRVRKDGATGVDGQTADEYAKNLEGNLQSLPDRAKSGDHYRAPPVRRVYIPKGDGWKTRPIGIPTFEDKILQKSVAMVMEAVYEQDFLPCSYGFRPGRGAHDALSALWTQTMAMGGGWILEADIEGFLDASSYCTLICCEVVEEARHCVGELDFQAFSPSLPDVDSLELATLYTLQDGLTTDAQSERGFEHRDVAGWRVVNETCAQLIGDANAPRSAGRELLAGDEAVVEPAVHGGGRNVENSCRNAAGAPISFPI